MHAGRLGAQASLHSVQAVQLRAVVGVPCVRERAIGSMPPAFRAGATCHWLCF